MRLIFGLLIAADILLASPKIVFEETEYDFGTVERGTKVTHYFVFKNAGDEPLEIKQVRATCGCTAALATKKVLQPGEEGKIKTTFNSRGYAGKIAKRVIVKTNDPDNPVINLIITGKVQVAYRVLPGFVSFGLVRPDSTPSETVKIYIEKKGAEVDSVLHTGDFYDLNVLGQKDSAYVLVVTLKKEKSEGNHSGRIDVYLKNTLDPLIRIPVTCEVLGDVKFVPSMISIGGIRGRKKEVELKIFYNEDKIEDINIDSLKAAVDYLKARVKSVEKVAKGEKVYKLEFEIGENAPTGMVQSSVHVYTDYPSKSDVELKLVGFIR